MSLSKLRSLVRSAGSEASEKNAIVKYLTTLKHRRMPSTSTARNGQKVVRTYLWTNTPLGNVALVTGPSMEGQVFLVDPVMRDVHADEVAVYIPPSGRRPAYAAFKQQRNSARRRRERAQAAAGSSRKPWGYEYNYRANTPDQVKIPLSKVSLSVPLDALNLPERPGVDLERCSTDSLLYDAQGRVYRVFYTVIATDDDGTGPVLASNLKDFAPTPGYPKVFQARALGRYAERQKINRMAQNLDPKRMLLPHADPTFGAPVVWEGNGEGGTKPGTYYVLGGNSRTVALLRADRKTYEKYLNEMKNLWPEFDPSKKVRKAGTMRGKRWIVVRVVAQDSCPTLSDARALNQQCQLTLKQAQGLAGATQASQAGAETPLGEAVSLMRGLGLDDLGTDLPPIQFTRTIARDNVMEFVDNSTNARFLRKLRDTMGAERYEGMMGDVDNAAKLLNSVLIAFLPEVIIEQGFPTERQERAVMAMLAPLVTIVFGEKQGRPPIPAGFDLFPYLIDAKSVLGKIKHLSFKDTLKMFDALTRQQTLTSAGLGADTPVQGLILGWLLKKAEKSRDPSIVVEKVLSAYVEAAMEAAQKYDTSQAGLFGASASGPMPASEPVQALLDAFLTIWTGRNEEAVQRLFEPMVRKLKSEPLPMTPPEPGALRRPWSPFAPDDHEGVVRMRRVVETGLGGKHVTGFTTKSDWLVFWGRVKGSDYDQEDIKKGYEYFEYRLPMNLLANYEAAYEETFAPEPEPEPEPQAEVIPFRPAPAPVVLTDDEFEAKYGVRPGDEFEDEHGTWIVDYNETKIPGMVNIYLDHRGKGHMIVVSVSELQSRYRRPGTEPAPAPVGPARYELAGETFTALPELKAGNLAFYHALDDDRPVLITKTLGGGSTRQVQGLSSLGRYSQRVTGRQWGADGWGEEKEFSAAPYFDNRRIGNQLGWQSWEQVRRSAESDLVKWLESYREEKIRDREWKEAERKREEAERAEKYAAGPDFREMANSLVEGDFIDDTIETAALKKWFKDNGVDATLKVRRYSMASGIDFGSSTGRFSDAEVVKITEMTDIRDPRHISGLLGRYNQSLQIKEPYVQQLKYILAKKANDKVFREKWRKGQKPKLTEAGKAALKAGPGTAKVKASAAATTVPTKELLAGQHRYIIEERDGTKGVYYGVVPLDRVDREEFGERRASAKAAGALGRGYFKAYRKGGIKGAFPFSSFKTAADWAATIWPGESVEIVTDEAVIEEIESLPVEAVEEVQATAEPEAAKPAEFDPANYSMSPATIKLGKKKTSPPILTINGFPLAQIGYRTMGEARKAFKELKKHKYESKLILDSEDEYESLRPKLYKVENRFSSGYVYALPLLDDMEVEIYTLDGGRFSHPIGEVSPEFAAAAGYRVTAKPAEAPKSLSRIEQMKQKQAERRRAREAAAVAPAPAPAPSSTISANEAFKQRTRDRLTKKNRRNGYRRNASQALSGEELDILRVEAQELGFTADQAADMVSLLVEVVAEVPGISVDDLFEQLDAIAVDYRETVLAAPAPAAPAASTSPYAAEDERNAALRARYEKAYATAREGMSESKFKLYFEGLPDPVKEPGYGLLYVGQDLQAITDKAEKPVAQMKKDKEEMRAELAELEAELAAMQAAAPSVASEPVVVVEGDLIEAPTREAILKYLQGDLNRSLTVDTLKTVFGLTDSRPVSAILRALKKVGLVKEESRGVYSAVGYGAQIVPLATTRPDLLRVLQIIFSGDQSDQGRKAVQALDAALRRADPSTRDRLLSTVAQMSGMCGLDEFGKALRLVEEVRGADKIREALMQIASQRFAMRMWIRSGSLKRAEGYGSVSEGMRVKVTSGPYKGSTGTALYGAQYARGLKGEQKKRVERQRKAQARAETGTVKATLVEFEAAGGPLADLAARIQQKYGEKAPSAPVAAQEPVVSRREAPSEPDVHPVIVQLDRLKELTGEDNPAIRAEIAEGKASSWHDKRAKALKLWIEQWIIPAKEMAAHIRSMKHVDDDGTTYAGIYSESNRLREEVSRKLPSNHKIQAGQFVVADAYTEVRAFRKVRKQKKALNAGEPVRFEGMTLGLQSYSPRYSSTPHYVVYANLTPVRGDRWRKEKKLYVPAVFADEKAAKQYVLGLIDDLSGTGDVRQEILDADIGKNKLSTLATPAPAAADVKAPVVPSPTPPPPADTIRTTQVVLGVNVRKMLPHFEVYATLTPTTTGGSASVKVAQFSYADKADADAMEAAAERYAKDLENRQMIALLEGAPAQLEGWISTFCNAGSKILVGPDRGSVLACSEANIETIKGWAQREVKDDAGRTLTAAQAHALYKEGGDIASWLAGAVETPVAPAISERALPPELESLIQQIDPPGGLKIGDLDSHTYYSLWETTPYGFSRWERDSMGHYIESTLQDAIRKSYLTNKPIIIFPMDLSPGTISRIAEFVEGRGREIVALGKASQAVYRAATAPIVDGPYDEADYGEVADVLMGISSTLNDLLLLKSSLGKPTIDKLTALKDWLEIYKDLKPPQSTLAQHPLDFPSTYPLVSGLAQVVDQRLVVPKTVRLVEDSPPPAIRPTRAAPKAEASTDRTEVFDRLKKGDTIRVSWRSGYVPGTEDPIIDTQDFEVGSKSSRKRGGMPQRILKLTRLHGSGREAYLSQTEFGVTFHESKYDLDNGLVRPLKGLDLISPSVPAKPAKAPAPAPAPAAPKAKKIPKARKWQTLQDVWNYAKEHGIGGTSAKYATQFVVRHPQTGRNYGLLLRDEDNRPGSRYGSKLPDLKLKVTYQYLFDRELPEDLGTVDFVGLNDYVEYNRLHRKIATIDGNSFPDHDVLEEMWVLPKDSRKRKPVLAYSFDVVKEALLPGAWKAKWERAASADAVLSALHSGAVRASDIAERIGKSQNFDERLYYSGMAYRTIETTLARLIDEGEVKLLGGSHGSERFAPTRKDSSTIEAEAAVEAKVTEGMVLGLIPKAGTGSTNRDRLTEKVMDLIEAPENTQVTRLVWARLETHLSALIAAGKVKKLPPEDRGGSPRYTRTPESRRPSEEDDKATVAAMDLQTLLETARGRGDRRLETDALQRIQRLAGELVPGIRTQEAEEVVGYELMGALTPEKKAQYYREKRARIEDAPPEIRALLTPTVPKYLSEIPGFPPHMILLPEDLKGDQKYKLWSYSPNHPSEFFSTSGFPRTGTQWRETDWSDAVWPTWGKRDFSILMPYAKTGPGQYEIDPNTLVEAIKCRGEVVLTGNWPKGKTEALDLAKRILLQRVDTPLDLNESRFEDAMSGEDEAVRKDIVKYVEHMWGCGIVSREIRKAAEAVDKDFTQDERDKQAKSAAVSPERWVALFDSLKNGDTVRVELRSVMGGGTKGLEDFRVGRRSHSKKYDVTTIKLMPMDGRVPSSGAQKVLRKRKDNTGVYGIGAGVGDMALTLVSLEKITAPKKTRTPTPTPTPKKAPAATPAAPTFRIPITSTSLQSELEIHREVTEPIDVMDGDPYDLDDAYGILIGAANDKITAFLVPDNAAALGRFWSATTTVRNALDEQLEARAGKAISAHERRILRGVMNAVYSAGAKALEQSGARKPTRAPAAPAPTPAPAAPAAPAAPTPAAPAAIDPAMLAQIISGSIGKILTGLKDK